jgi:hypothetical protein
VQAERKGVDFGSTMGSSMKKANCECHPNHHLHPPSSSSIPCEEREESLVTPLKPTSSV